MDNTSAATSAIEREVFVQCRNSQGIELRARVTHFTRYAAVFEIHSPDLVLRMSEVLSQFKILLDERLLYSGRAVISNLVNTGTGLICQANLEECWVDLSGIWPGPAGNLRAGFGEFLDQWQKTYRVQSKFKLVVADMQSLLADLRLWLDQVELGIRSSPSGRQGDLDRAAAAELAEPIVPAIEALGDRFEEIAGGLDPQEQPAHIHFTRRHLHSLLLGSPFAYRTFQKPLGYAGDYEMVNMIVRDPYQGGSLFAKVINAWFLQQLPAIGHRNRLKLLTRRLVEESSRMASLGKPARIFNLGCGPAGEIQEFLRSHRVCDHAQFTLLDFNEETLQHTTGILRGLTRQFERRTPIQMQKKSVQQVLKEAAKPGASISGGNYDLLYCAGLFDYLSDRVCKQLMSVFYKALAPGGLLLVTNVDGTRPFRHKLEFILDWNLIYRNAGQMAALRPDDASPETCTVTADFAGVNLFLEIRKPVDV